MTGSGGCGRAPKNSTMSCRSPIRATPFREDSAAEWLETLLLLLYTHSNSQECFITKGIKFGVLNLLFEFVKFTTSFKDFSLIIS